MTGTNSRTTEALVQTGLMEFARTLASGDAEKVTAQCLRICTEDLGFDAGALVETEPGDAEEWSATATDPRVQALVEIDLAVDDGPCRTVLQRAEAITVDLLQPDRAWRDFAAHARTHGMTWAHAQPVT